MTGPFVEPAFFVDLPIDLRELIVDLRGAYQIGCPAHGVVTIGL